MSDEPTADEADGGQDTLGGETMAVEEGAEGPVIAGTGDLPETEQEAERLQNLGEEIVDLRNELEQVQPLDEENPLGVDPRVGVKDIAFDRAKPGAKVYVVDVLAESVPDYYEEFPDAPELDGYAGNVVTRFRDADAVFACVYVKDSLTSVDTNITAYLMPESRLTRFPAEQATMVGSSSVEFARTNLPEETDE